MKKYLLLFFFTIVLYFVPSYALHKTGINSLYIQSEDTVPTMFLTVAIIKDQTLHLDKYYSQMLHLYPNPDDKKFEKGLVPFYIKKIGNHYLSAFPVITSILLLPIFFVPLILGVSTNIYNLAVMSHIGASVIVSLSGVLFLYFLTNGLKISQKFAYLLTFIYLFCTINFALLSQSVWQHCTLELLTIASLIFLYKYFQKPTSWKDVFYSGVFLSFAILSRPTAALFLPFWFALIFTNPNTRSLFIKSCLYLLLGFVPAVVFFLWYNQTFYVDISNQGYAGQVFNYWLSRFPEGFLGVWLSPSKGIFVYSPIFIFILYSIYLQFHKDTKTKISKDYLVFIFLVFVHTLIISKWKHWYGGWSFGYRMSSDVIPFMVLSLVPCLNYLSAIKKRIFMFLAIFSFVIQLYGLIFFDGVWHSAYDRGFVDTGWLWSIRDSEVAFNFRRVLVKLDLLDRACPKCE